MWGRRCCAVLAGRNPWITVHWVVLFVALLVAAISVPCSLLWRKPEVINACTDLSPRIRFLPNSTGLVSDFEEFAAKAMSTLDICIALPATFEETPPAFTAALESALGRGVAVRIFTNNGRLSVPAGAKVKYFQQNYVFEMNFVVRDGAYIFMPSSFFGVDGTLRVPAVAYAAQFGKCESAGQDLLSLFDLLWNRKKNVQEYKWMARKGFNPVHAGLQFLLDPPHLFPLGRKNHTSVIFDALDWASDQKIVFTRNIFPQNMSDVDNAYVGATVSGLFELNQYNEESLELVLSRTEFNLNLEPFYSLVSNMQDPYLFLCAIDFDVTMIVSKKRLVFFPSGISDVFTGNTVSLGFVLEADYLKEVRDLKDGLCREGTCASISPM